MADPAGTWMLIAVLRSNLPLAEALALRLYHAAVDLERERGGSIKLNGDLALGEVRRLGRSMLLGSIHGPAFEAELETPSGSGQVRFILTQQALAMAGLGDDEPATPASPPRLLN